MIQRNLIKLIYYLNIPNTIKYISKMVSANCSCSRYCRVHGTHTDITEIGYTKVGMDKGKTLTLIGTF